MASAAVVAPASALQMWTIFDRPTDFPTSIVARRWTVGRGGVAKPDHFCIVADKIEAVREWLAAAGMMVMPRLPDDDTNIVETWF